MLTKRKWSGSANPQANLADLSVGPIEACRRPVLGRRRPFRPHEVSEAEGNEPASCVNKTWRKRLCQFVCVRSAW
jgi:hypothetical protein